MQFKRTALILGCLGTLPACGDLGDSDERSPLAVIEGQLSTTSASLKTPSNVRVAVVWNSSATGYKSSLDVNVSPVFPSKFRLELVEPPPASAMVGALDATPAPTQDNPLGQQVHVQTRPANANGSATRYAIGSIVAYEDLNGDGQLNLVDGGQSPIDRVLGTNASLLVVYVEGDVPAVDPFYASSVPTRGYNLLKAPRCAPAKRGLGAPPEACEPRAWLSISTPYELALTAEPQLAELMCASAFGQSTASPTSSNVAPGEEPPPAPGPGPAGWPKRDDANLVCSADGKTYSYYECTSTSEGLCKATHERCSVDVRAWPSSPPPAEWPCTIP